MCAYVGEYIYDTLYIIMENLNFGFKGVSTSRHDLTWGKLLSFSGSFMLKIRMMASTS